LIYQLVQDPTVKVSLVRKRSEMSGLLGQVFPRFKNLCWNSSHSQANFVETTAFLWQGRQEKHLFLCTVWKHL